MKPTLQDRMAGTWLRTQKLDDGSQISVMKIITATRFAVFQKDAAAKKHDLFQGHAGPYTLEDATMTEKYEFSSNPQLVGKTARCRVEVEGDTLRQIWKLEDGTTQVEVWKRELVIPVKNIPKP